MVITYSYQFIDMQFNKKNINGSCHLDIFNDLKPLYYFPVVLRTETMQK